MKIFISGSNGMVGKNLSIHLAKNHQLLTPSSRELNLFNYQDVEHYLKEYNPEFIIHCAGRVGGIQANIRSSAAFLVENFDMGKNLALAARESRVKNFLNLGSSCMYPRDYKNPLKEEYILAAQLEPTNEGYALAKIAIARLCQYINSEDPYFQYKTLIPSNLYGPYDKFDPEVSHMIPAVIRKIHLAKTNNHDQVTIWGDGKTRREFLFVPDLADFVDFALENYTNVPQYLNIGLGRDYTILEYYQIIANVIGYEGEFVFDKTKPTGMPQKLVDNTKIKQLGWDNITPLEEGIAQTYQHFLEENYV